MLYSSHHVTFAIFSCIKVIVRSEDTGEVLSQSDTNSQASLNFANPTTMCTTTNTSSSEFR